MNGKEKNEKGNAGNKAHGHGAQLVNGRDLLFSRRALWRCTYRYN